MLRLRPQHCKKALIVLLLVVWAVLGWQAHSRSISRTLRRVYRLYNSDCEVDGSCNPTTHQQAVREQPRATPAALPAHLPVPLHPSQVRYVFASLVVRSLHRDELVYTQQARLWALSLMSQNIAANKIVILVATNLQYITMLQDLGVELIPVAPLVVKGTTAGYELMTTKLHLWNLTQFDIVAYYDTDFLFLSSPLPLFASCGDAELCACDDIRLSKGSVGKYFNAGMMVLRPSRQRYEALLADKHLADGREFAEQDYLNDYFDGEWRVLSPDFNRMLHAKMIWPPRTTVAWHAKMWEIGERVARSRRREAGQSERDIGKPGARWDVNWSLLLKDATGYLQ